MAKSRKKTEDVEMVVGGVDGPMPGGNDVIDDDDEHCEFFPTGCTLVDCALGGGWAKDRMLNIIGDSSVGKTLWALEAATNFIHKYGDDALVEYYETEAVLEKRYARQIGLPTDRVVFTLEEEKNEKVIPLVSTVEYWLYSMLRFADKCDQLGKHGLYIVDSLDAMTDAKEEDLKEAGFSDKQLKEAGYSDDTLGDDDDDDEDVAESHREASRKSMLKADQPGRKAKVIGKVLRLMARRMKHSHVTLMVISQVRDKIGVKFGRKWTVAGGRSRKFYTTHIVVLSEIKKNFRTIKGVKRVVGMTVKFVVEKNKVAEPWRDGLVSMVFQYGMDDVATMYGWLKSVNALKDFPEYEQLESIAVNDMLALVSPELAAKLREFVIKRWKEIEDGFQPARRKYPGVTSADRG